METIEILTARAKLYESIRAFLKARYVLEVNTALLRYTVGLESHIDPIEVPKKGFLQTSPEIEMKKLLAKNVGSIYQICHAFRNNEFGKYHRQEFSMLEWYRIDFNYHDLMEEIDSFLQIILKTKPAQKITYQKVFIETVGFDPHVLTREKAKKVLKFLNISLSDLAEQNLNIEDYLEIIFSNQIEPTLGQDRPVFIYDYPTNQAALAKIKLSDPPVAQRFELYYKSIELANGYYELTDPIEQEKRFIQDNKKRESQGRPLLPIDKNFIIALSGMPECSGVALGLDRLLMLKTGASMFECSF